MANIPSHLIDDFLGSAHIFFSAVNELAEVYQKESEA